MSCDEIVSVARPVREVPAEIAVVLVRAALRGAECSARAEGEGLGLWIIGSTPERSVDLVDLVDELWRAGFQPTMTEDDTALWVWTWPDVATRPGPASAQAWTPTPATPVPDAARATVAGWATEVLVGSSRPK